MVENENNTSSHEQIMVLTSTQALMNFIDLKSLTKLLVSKGIISQSDLESASNETIRNEIPRNELYKFINEISKMDRP